MEGEAKPRSSADTAGARRDIVFMGARYARKAWLALIWIKDSTEKRCGGAMASGN
jgi:hypothetical protein